MSQSTRSALSPEVKAAIRRLPRITRHLDEEELARKRMGDDPSARLRWVLDFVAQDLNALRPEEKVALGYDLRRFLPVGWMKNTPYSPLPLKAITEIHREVSAGIRSLLTDPRSYRDGPALFVDSEAGWKLPPVKTRIVRWSLPYSKTDKGTDRRTKFFVIRSGDDEKATILWGIADLLLNAGEKLRACDECRAPFVATKRQEFCTPECGQRVRNMKKAKQKGGSHGTKRR